MNLFPSFIHHIVVDGDYVPVPMGAEDPKPVTLDSVLDETEGGDEDGGTTLKDVIGVGLYTPDRQYAGTLEMGASSNDPVSSLFGGGGQRLQLGGQRFNGGEFVTATGKHVFLLADGSVKDSRTLSEKERTAFFSDNPSGGGGGGGSATPYGYTSPDPGAAITAIFKKYEYDLLVASKDRTEAKENFEQRMSLFEATQRGEISYGQFLQNAAITEAELTSARDDQLIEIAKAKQTDERERGMARVNRDLSIGQMRQQAGTDWLREGAPKALPSNVTGIRIPGIPEPIGTTTYNPDDLMGIPYMNSIRDIPDSTVAFPEPSAVPTIPIPNITAPPAELQQPLPNYTMPQVPDISGIIQQLLSGSAPMGWA